MEFCDYRHEDWDDVQAFLHAHWRPNHPFTRPEIFNWQLTGFGGFHEPVSKLIRKDGEILGFLGGIPGLYHRDEEIIPGVAFDVWIVRPDVQKLALGLLLMKTSEDRFEACCSLGVNRDIVHYYTCRGYQYCEGMHRWIAPLALDGLQRLIAPAARDWDQLPAGVGAQADIGRAARADAIGEARPEARGWSRECSSAALSSDDLTALTELHERVLAHPAATVTPRAETDPAALETLYSRTAAQVLRFGLYRTAEFWTWRYLRSAGYKYLFFGDAATGGMIIARVERVISVDWPEMDGLQVLRLIELLPPQCDAWEGLSNQRFAELLAGVLQWGARQGCLLADYQNSSDRLAPLLQGVGFDAQASTTSPALRAVPNLFQPLRYDVPPINFVFRPRPAAEETTLDLRDVYFVKSDAGMDRPNIWPLPPERA